MNEEFQERRAKENEGFRAGLENWKRGLEKRLPDDIKSCGKWLSNAIECKKGEYQLLSRISPESTGGVANEIAIFEIQKRIVEEVKKGKGIK